MYINYIINLIKVLLHLIIKGIFMQSLNVSMFMFCVSVVDKRYHGYD